MLVVERSTEVNGAPGNAVEEMLVKLAGNMMLVRLVAPRKVCALIVLTLVAERSTEVRLGTQKV